MDYLFILADQNLRPLRSKLKELGAFFTGIGYAICASRETETKAFCLAAGLKYHRQPIPSGHTFESFEQSHKASFFKDKLISLERDIDVLRRELNVDSEEELSQTTRGLKLLELLSDAEDLKGQIKRSELFEKTLSVSSAPLSVQFLSQMPVNFLLEDAPEIPRLINVEEGKIQKPFLRKGILAMLVGAGGVGKTHALAQLALSLATGYPWLDVFPIEKPGHVFLGLGENNLSDIHRLLRKIAKHFLQRIKTDQYVFFDPDPLIAAMERIAPMAFSGVDAAFIHQGQPTAFFNTLLASLKQTEPPEGWSCIILDPISRFIGMDAETDNAAATQFIALLEKLSMELKGNPTVIFGHHMNKGGVSGLNTDQAAARGSSAITDGVRWQVNLEKSRQEEMDSNREIIFRHVKSNFTAILPTRIVKKDEMGCLSAASDPLPRRVKTEMQSGGQVKLNWRT
ncbi:MAG: AAA family ATPase [Chlamydiae bacterium]|nr:AAA family ATPase [Chlamydiota bacterium]